MKKNDLNCSSNLKREKKIIYWVHLYETWNVNRNKCGDSKRNIVGNNTSNNFKCYKVFIKNIVNVHVNNGFCQNSNFESIRKNSD